MHSILYAKYVSILKKTKMEKQALFKEMHRNSQPGNLR